MPSLTPFLISPSRSSEALLPMLLRTPHHFFHIQRWHSSCKSDSLINSLNIIIDTIAPSTLSSYWSAWKSFHHIHLQYNFTFPSFDLVTMTYTIKGYFTASTLLFNPSHYVCISKLSQFSKGIVVPKCYGRFLSRAPHNEATSQSSRPQHSPLCFCQ